MDIFGPEGGVLLGDTERRDLLDVESPHSEQEDAEDIDDSEAQADQPSQEQLQWDVPFRVFKLELKGGQSTVSNSFLPYPRTQCGCP